MANPFEQSPLSPPAIVEPRTPSPITAGNYERFSASTPELKEHTEVDVSNVLQATHSSTTTAHNHQQRERPTLDSVARALLDEKFILSALEFHTELLESGRNLKRLNDFFSNPVNFEHIHGSMGATAYSPGFFLQRTSSAQTFDSLDFTHGSDDAEHKMDDRLAVLEFELRQAKETINSLRAQLTSVSEEQSVPSKSDDMCATSADQQHPDRSHHRLSDPSAPVQRTSGPRPHEQRAINYLVYEYLLQTDYKLASVTLAEEAADQDFDDWDDVGLNTPRPSDLVTLYRQFCHATPSFVQTADAECSCDMTEEEHNNSNPFGSGAEEVEQQEDDDLSLMLSPNSALNELNEMNRRLIDENSELCEEIKQLKLEIQKLETKVKNATFTNNEVVVGEQSSQSEMSARSKRSQERVVTCLTATTPIERCRKISSHYVATMQTLAKVTYADQQASLSAQLDPCLSDTRNVLYLIADALPTIVPNILLNKRADVVPLLLVCCILVEQVDEQGATADSDKSSAAPLLSELFNLIKKPVEDQRRLLVAALVHFAARVGPTRTETQLLPLCWEQMNHKHEERRLLVADTCAAVAAYIPPSLLSSLVLSMLQQMLSEDRSPMVRQAVVCALATTCLYVEDQDKFTQLNDLCWRALMDSDENVVCRAQRLFLPALAVWADEIGKLHQTLVAVMVRKLVQLFTVGGGGNQSANEPVMCVYIGCLRALTPVLFWSVLHTAELPKLEDVSSVLNDDRLETDPDSFCVGDISEDPAAFATLVNRFDAHTSQECLPQLVTVTSQADIGLSRMLDPLIDYMQHFCGTFGRGFTVTKVRPLFRPLIYGTSDSKTVDSAVLEECTVDLQHCSLVVYCAGVLCAFDNENDWIEVRKLLRAKIVEVGETSDDAATLSTSTSVITVTFLQLFNRCVQHRDTLLLIPHEYLCHTSVGVRSLCACVLSALVPTHSCTTIDAVRKRVMPALVTLAADENPQVRCSTCAGLMAVAERAVDDPELMEKARVQLASLFGDSDVSVNIELVRCVAQTAPNLEAHFRDHFILVQLCALAQRTSSLSASDPGRHRLAACLFDAYSALSCCFVSASAIANSLLPGMRHLLVTLDPQHVKIANSILRDAETKLNQAAAAADAANPPVAENVRRPDTASVDEAKQRMFDAFRDIKDRVDHHGVNVPNLFRKKR